MLPNRLADGSYVISPEENTKEYTMGLLRTKDGRLLITDDRLTQCRLESPTFKMLCDNCPYHDINRWTYETYLAMSLWSHALADAALEAGFEDVAEYERWWANDWLKAAAGKPYELIQEGKKLAPTYSSIYNNTPDNLDNKVEDCDNWSF